MASLLEILQYNQNLKGDQNSVRPLENWLPDSGVDRPVISIAMASFRNRPRTIAASAGSGGRYVGPDNPVRFIEAFVDGPDLKANGFVRVVAKDTGRLGFDPAYLLKLYSYGYINRMRSSRWLEAETPSQH